MIYPVDSVIQPLNNPGLIFNFVSFTVIFIAIKNCECQLIWCFRMVPIRREKYFKSHPQNRILVPLSLAKLGNIVAEATVSQFSRAGNICCENNFCWSETKNAFCLKSKTFLLPEQMLLSKHMFPSLATMKTMLTRFQCCSLKILVEQKPQAMTSGWRILVPRAGLRENAKASDSQDDESEGRTRKRALKKSRLTGLVAERI